MEYQESLIPWSMIDDTELPKLLRYLSGESSPVEAGEIQARLARDPEFRRQVEAWQQVRDARPPAWDTEQALTALHRELGFGDRRPAVRVVPFPERVIPARRRMTVRAFRVAAALLVGVGVAALWRMDRAPSAAVEGAASVAMQEYVTPRGRRAALTLPDGTQVMLAADTRLRVPHDFGRRGARREVRLEGQAYFRVTHDATRPFLVHTATSVTEDLGTVFTVRAYPAEAEVEVVVAEGIVAVAPARAGLGGSGRRVLAPGQLARVDMGGRLQTEHDVDLTRYLAWTTGRLAFDGTSFRRVAADVERWYDLDIRLADSALGRRRVGGVVAGESADAVLGYLARAIDARYERQGRTVTFWAP